MLNRFKCFLIYILRENVSKKTELYQVFLDNFCDKMSQNIEIVYS